MVGVAREVVEAILVDPVVVIVAHTEVVDEVLAHTRSKRSVTRMAEEG